MAATIIPVLGHDYEVSGDGAVYHDGRFLRGIFLNEDGAWAGRLRDDGWGAWTDMAMDDNDDFVPAKWDWDTYIVRELPGFVAAHQ